MVMVAEKANFDYRRSDFLHYWFKNQYINRLDACIVRLKTEGADISRIRRFVTQDFSEWEKKREIVRELIVSLEAEKALKLVDCQYCALKKVIESLNQFDSEQLALLLLPGFESFRRACIELSQVL